MKTKIHHISISSNNLYKDIKFYKDIFDFSLFKEFKDNDIKIILLKKDEIILEIFSFDKMNKLPEYKNEILSDIKTVGINHFAFSVESLEGFKKKLIENNIKIFKDITYGNILKYIFIKDFSGNLVEIVEDD